MGLQTKLLHSRGTGTRAGNYMGDRIDGKKRSNLQIDQAQPTHTPTPDPRTRWYESIHELQNQSTPSTTVRNSYKSPQTPILAPTLPLPHSLLPNPNFPNVDVIIPCYNASSTIEAALSSAYYQNYEGLISIVTYDDNSVDETEKRVLEFRSSHPSTPSRKLIHKSAPPDKRDPGGAGYARNRCVEAGSGEVLVLLDSDDVMMPARVKEQVELLMSLKVRWGGEATDLFALHRQSPPPLSTALGPPRGRGGGRRAGLLNERG